MSARLCALALAASTAPAVATGAAVPVKFDDVMQTLDAANGGELIVDATPALGDGNATTVNVTQVHLALTTVPEAITVSWACDAPTMIRWGTDAQLKNPPVPPFSSETYTMVSVPVETDSFVNYTSPVLNHATIAGLSPRETYFYQIVPVPDPQKNSTAPVAAPSGIFKFTTPPAIGDTAPMIFDVVGDLGQTNYSVDTMAHIIADAENATEFLLHVGDMSYADCLNPRWDSYFELIEPLASRLPWMVTAGNHEIEPNNLTGHIMDPYKARYQMPQFAPTVDTTEYFQNLSYHGLDCTPDQFVGSYDYGNSFYSFRAGMVHFIVLNPYTHTENASNQFDWLNAELSTRVDKSVTPWTMAMWHNPWYNSNPAHQNEYPTTTMRASMEQLMVDAGVAVIFNGHVHAYERTYPVAFNQTNSSAPTYIVIGDGGNREGHAPDYPADKPDWSAFRNASDYGHGRMRILNTSHAVWEWHTNQADEWIVSDSAIITNPHAGPAPAPAPSCNATDLVKNHTGPPALCAYESNRTHHHTVGYGFDMETSFARKAFADIGIDYDKVFFGDSCINQTDADILLQMSLQIAAFQAVTAVGPSYASLCCPIANALVDITYNLTELGTPIYSFGTLIQDLLAKNYSDAKSVLSSTEWCNHSAVACADDANTIGQGC